MTVLPSSTVREYYLAFFEERGHVRIQSAPLVPDNDSTTLFTGSGMQPMLPYLLGQPHPLGQRIADSQKCLRAVDIDDVGDNRHTTFFEMLGNWSLGDYFKAEQIAWMFEFLVDKLHLDPSRLYITAFRGQPSLNVPRDEETAKLWQEQFKNRGIVAEIVDHAEVNGMQNGRIFYYDEQKNWWSRSGVPANMPSGEPGGPDTEMFWDFGEDLKLHESSPWYEQRCHVNCDCGRFMEIGNNVFMQYQKVKDGFSFLPQQNVDFGGGLERLSAALNNNPDVFRIDVFSQSIDLLQRLSGIEYGRDTATTKAFRVIMDHVRAATFLIADGVAPAIKDQGYFTRRLIRRAVRFGANIGLDQNFCAQIAESFISYYSEAYPLLVRERENILATITKEEEKFKAGLASGLKILEQALAQTTNGIIAAETVFNLYQSYGFPLEMTEEIAHERGLKVDREGFNEAFADHQAKSRSGGLIKFKGGLADHSEQSTHYHTATHLLHQSLRQVLGEHVVQRGSNITPERLRFDFFHPQKLRPDEIAAVERLVNEQIEAGLPVTRREMTVDEAKKNGAMGLFEHKYGEKVSVYSIGEFSREICGGPHVTNTQMLGTFKITREESASAGIRRIKAILVK